MFKSEHVFCWNEWNTWSEFSEWTLTDLVQKKQLTGASVTLNILIECSKHFFTLPFKIRFECSKVENTVNFWACVSFVFIIVPLKNMHIKISLAVST